MACRGEIPNPHVRVGDEDWWRRGESNSRPKQCSLSFYARVLPLSLI
jgi:hypothetical protein